MILDYDDGDDDDDDDNDENLYCNLCSKIIVNVEEEDLHLTVYKLIVNLH